MQCQRNRDVLAKAAGRMRNIKLVGAWNKWLELITLKREKEGKLAK